MTTTQQLQRWTRDDWVIPCNVVDKTNSAVPLTGKTIAAEFSISGYRVASDLTVANGGIVRVSDANGQFIVNVPRLLTARAPSDAGLPLEAEPTRVLLYWIDTNLKRQTLGVIPFEVFDGTENLSIDEVPNLTIVYTDATFTIQVAAQTGAAGPSSIASSQITDATPVGRQVLLGTTAAAIRAIIGSPGIGRTAVNDLNYHVLATDVYVGYSALTAPRSAYLPPASTYPAGQTLTIADETGNCSSTLSITVVADGSGDDTIAGSSSVTMKAPYRKLTFQSDGTSLWTVILSNVDNTSDLNKPLSTAAQAAFNLAQNPTVLKGIVPFAIGRALWRRGLNSEDVGLSVDPSNADQNTARINQALEDVAYSGVPFVLLPTTSGTAFQASNVAIPSGAHFQIDGGLQLRPQTDPNAATNVISISNTNDWIIDGAGYIDGNASAVLSNNTQSAAGIGGSGGSHGRIRIREIRNTKYWPVNMTSGCRDIIVEGSVMHDAGASCEFAIGATDCHFRYVKVYNIDDEAISFSVGSPTVL